MVVNWHIFKSLTFFIGKSILLFEMFIQVTCLNAGQFTAGPARFIRF